MSVRSLANVCFDGVRLWPKQNRKKKLNSRPTEYRVRCIVTHHFAISYGCLQQITNVDVSREIGRLVYKPFKSPSTQAQPTEALLCAPNGRLRFLFADPKAAPAQKNTQ